MTDIVQIGIPKPIANDIYKIIGVLGYHSLTEFCLEAVRKHLQEKNWQYEKKVAEQEEAIVQKHEKGEESIGFDKES
jgi:metal-responsive CopG/Arc/MetJ family transcriptional regulator